MMGVRHLAVLLSLLLASGHVTSFSIGGVSRRSKRNTDLADALAILQRQRRRVGLDDYLGSERLLESRPLTLDDVSDWLSRTEESNELDSDWLSDKGNFKDFDEDPELSRYELPPLIAPPALEREPEAEEASRSELEDIFSEDDEGESPLEKKSAPAKKKKEEMLNVKGDKKSPEKKSVHSEEGLALDTLTQDEFKALMKAVQKLQRQAEKLSDKSTSESIVEPVEVKETMVDAIPIGDGVAVAEPVSEEELESVFDDGEGPIMQETHIVDEAVPGPNGETVIERTVQTDSEPVDEESEEALKDAIASEIEQGIQEEEEAAENIAEDLEDLEEDTVPDLTVDPEKLASMEKFWLMNKYMDKNVPQKRTAKRAVVVPDRLLDEASEALETALEQQDNELREEEEEEEEAAEELAQAEAEAESRGSSGSALSNLPSVEMFLEKILQLQGEVDRLRLVTRLEDLENDVLTDALNEATLGQKEGTVSDLEFGSLKQAIELEEALQELKASPDSDDDPAVHESNDVIKRGEPWRRKRLPEAASHTGSRDSKFKMADVDRLLDLAYRKPDEDEPRGDDGVASLFLKNADSCPAVREYNTNCELADLYSLPVDYEARALCNLHQMCYSCGHSLSVEQDHCDFVYREAAAALCQDKEDCVVESEIFLRTMKLKTRYIPHNQPLCRSTCTARFLGML